MHCFQCFYRSFADDYIDMRIKMARLLISPRFYNISRTTTFFFAHLYWTSYIRTSYMVLWYCMMMSISWIQYLYLLQFYWCSVSRIRCSRGGINQDCSRLLIDSLIHSFFLNKSQNRCVLTKLHNRKLQKQRNTSKLANTSKV